MTGGIIGIVLNIVGDIKMASKFYCKTYINERGTYITICNYKYGHAQHAE